jgi:LppP/LprE lipoprotein
VPRRYLVHRRSAFAKWTRRVFGVLGTAVVLALWVVVAGMILPGKDNRAVDDAPASTANDRTTAAAQAKRRAEARRRAQRRRAVARVRRAGYAPVRLDDYRARQDLRVLIGRPVGGTPDGLRAFFFARGRYVGRDAPTPSGKLRPGRQLGREITLVYTLYEPGDQGCCPSGGDTRVHFRLRRGTLRHVEPIPPDFQRLPPG